MNKNIFFAILAGAALVSCSNNDVLEDIPEQPVEINFEEVLNQATRAEISDQVVLAPNGFAVYGYKYNTDLTWTDWSSPAGNVIFNNVQVTGNAKYYTAETAAAYNAKLTGNITTSTELSAEQAKKLNNLKGGYNEGDNITSAADIALYNSDTEVKITTETVLTAGQASRLNSLSGVSPTYAEGDKAESEDVTLYNTGLTLDPITTGTALTADQATKLNTLKVVTTYVATNKATSDDVVLYNESLTNAVKAGDVDPGTWTYTDKRYWDKNSDYNFYAIAPYEGTPNYSIAANGMFTIENVASGLATDSKDYIIDRDGAAVDGNYSGTHDKVGFNFHHTMAKIDFKLAKASGITGDLLVKKITMTGWKNGAGKFVQTATTTPGSSDDYSEWTITATTTGSVDILNNSTGVAVTSTDTYGTNTYIMVPQEIADDVLTFTVDYTLGGEPFSAQVATVDGAQKWGTDSHTTYTLTIGPAAIEFNVNSICGFCNNATGTVTVQ